MTAAYRYRFPPGTSPPEVRATLGIAMLAVEGLHGTAARLEASPAYDPDRGTCVVPADSPAGRDLNRILVGLVAEMEALAPNPGDLFGGRNWNSPDRIKAAFQALGVALDTTDDAALAAADHPLAAALRDYRSAVKRSGTYGARWLADHAPDGSVLCRWNQLGAASGRMSAADPNLQQVPRTADYRRCFTARPGNVLVKADYSQIELRIAAKLTGEAAMIDAYARGDDLHARTAARVLNKPADTVTKADRQLAKAVNFGLLFGMGFKSLRAYARTNYGVALTETEAQAYRLAFFRAYPALAGWHDRVGREVKRRFRADPAGTHAVRTLGGRRRVLPVGKGAPPNRAKTVEGPFGVTLTFGYDAAGNRDLVSDNKGGLQNSTYDGLNRLASRTQVPLTGSPIRAEWGYDAEGDLVSLTRSTYAEPTGWTKVGSTAYDHDTLGRTKGITHLKANGVTVLATYGYAYDAADRLTSQTVNGVARTYGYDDADQLTSDNGKAYTYDANGNRTNAGYVMGPGNRLLSDGVWTYTYDAAGQVTGKAVPGGGKAPPGEVYTYQYDHRGQMVTAQKRPAGPTSPVINTTTFSRDAYGNAIARSEAPPSPAPPAVTRQVFDGWDPAKAGMAVGAEHFDSYADADAAGNLSSRRMFGAGIDELVARQTPAGVTGWYGTDRQGSVRQVFDNAMAVVASADYDAWGNLTSGALSDKFGYAGREWVTSLGVYDNHQRMYSPTAGRFYGEDPTRFAAGDPNLYRYAGNSPTNATDPSGLEGTDDTKGALDAALAKLRAVQGSRTDAGRRLAGVLGTTTTGPLMRYQADQLRGNLYSDIPEVRRAYFTTAG